MTQAKDELFCRLALRQGLLTKEDATAILREYRSEARSGEGIGAFIVRQGHLDGSVVSTLEGAIARRADGHVADTRRRVPKRGTSAGHAPATRATHRVSSARQAKASGAQVAMVAIAGVVFLGAVLTMAFWFSKDPVKAPAEEENNTAASSSDLPVHTLEHDAIKETVIVTLSAQDIENFGKRANQAKTDASIEAADERFGRALKYIRAGIKQLGGDQTPSQIHDVLGELQDLEKEYVAQVEEAYAEQLVRLTAAKDESERSFVLDDILRICGPEKHEMAAAAGKSEEKK